MKTITLHPLQTPVTKTVTVPGSKSLTNRALCIAALTAHDVVITNYLVSDDTTAMIEGLHSLGIKITKGKNSLHIHTPQKKQLKNRTIQANLSGTTMRFLLAYAALTSGVTTLTGEGSLLKRPIGDLVDALRKLGAEIIYLDQEGFPPVQVTRPITQVHSNTITIDGSMSSQFISALLMIAPLIGPLRIAIKGKVVSQPYIELTTTLMKQCGVSVQIQGNQYQIEQQEYTANRIAIEGDASSACYFGAIAALTKSTITINNISRASIQPDMQFFSVLEKMGNTISTKNNSITIHGKSIKALSVDMLSCPDQIPTLAVLATFANGKTHITGIQTLTFKETDRLHAIQQELQKMHITTKVEDNVLTIIGGTPIPAAIATYQDHRMAMSFAVAGSILPNITIEDPEVVTKTFPKFFQELTTIGITQIPKENIVLIGFMCAGKTTIAPLLAKKLHKKIIEIDKEVTSLAKKTTSEIFATEGEKGYREYELQATKHIKDTTPAIISTGGGTVMNKLTIDYLKEKGLVIFLDTPFEEIVKRLNPKLPRPLFTTLEQAKDLYDLRYPLYKAYADIIITTKGKSPEEIAQKIKESII